MTLTINMADGNTHRFEARDGEELFRKREYIVSIVIWED